jgi:hypothetical protein
MSSVSLKSMTSWVPWLSAKAIAFRTSQAVVTSCSPSNETTAISPGSRATRTSGSASDASFVMLPPPEEPRVIEAELIQLASCSLWLASPRRSPGRSRPDLATAAGRSCMAVRQPRHQRSRSESFRANARRRPEFERWLGSIPRGAEAVLRRPPGTRRTRRRRGRPTRPQDASRSQRPVPLSGSPSRPPLGSASAVSAWHLLS